MQSSRANSGCNLFLHEAQRHQAQVHKRGHILGSQSRDCGPSPGTSPFVTTGIQLLVGISLEITLCGSRVRMEASPTISLPSPEGRTRSKKTQGFWLPRAGLESPSLVGFRNPVDVALQDTV